MSQALTFERVLWGVTFSLNAGLVVLLVSRKNHRVFPFFSLYALVNLLQGIVLFEIYRTLVFGSQASILVAWGTQFVVTMTRALAVAELCHRTLAKYQGVWKLVRLLLLVAAGIVAAAAWAFSRGNWRSAILSFDRGLELAMASAIVLLFVFARYYDVRLESAVRTLATGFFLYSGFRVLNNTLAEGLLTNSTGLWNLLGTLTFLASLLLWIWALRLTQQQTAAEPELLPEDHYRSLSPAINARLRSLNEQLSHFWYAEGKKT